MRYRFKENETVTDGVRRILLEQIDKAINSLDPEVRNKDRAIHQTRICFKRIRAVIKLVKDDLGPEVYERENLEYRDAGRRLSSARDVAVIMRSLEEILQDFGSQSEFSGIKRLRKQLLKSKVREQLDRKSILIEVAETVKAARQRVETWPELRNDFSSLGAGLKRRYRRGLNSYTMICEDPRTESLHEWRKQVKNLGYQISLFDSVWPKMLDTLENEFNKLASYLSDDHDLALLRNRALDLAQDADDAARIESFVDFVDKRRAVLQSKARALGARLYAEKPGAFSNRLQAYWQQWRPFASTPEEPQLQTTFASVDATFDSFLHGSELIISPTGD